MPEILTDDVQALLGKEVLQICYGLYQQQVRLDGDMILSFEGTYMLEHENAAAQFRCDTPQECAGLMSLLGTSVATIEAHPDRLRLGFSNGYGLVFEKNSEGYETITIDGPSLFYVL